MDDESIFFSRAARSLGPPIIMHMNKRFEQLKVIHNFQTVHLRIPAAFSYIFRSLFEAKASPFVRQNFALPQKKNTVTIAVTEPVIQSRYALQNSGRFLKQCLLISKGVASKDGRLALVCG